ncbi:phage tail terminator protein [Gluconobacter albidus]|uniref:phage tail terminator protein n=1 Tax=Gluconobacter albidus TaxID=318683 RepID=UPI0007839C74|nr:hypothetical protein [Gluconobacter albidus]
MNPILRCVDVIKQIRTNTQYFTKVSGIGDISRMMNQQNIKQSDMPFCGVWIPNVTATENQNMPGYLALETTTFQCVIVLNMETDDTGYQSASDAYDLARADLRKCLMGWDPTPDRSNGYPMQFEGGSIVGSLDSSNSRAVYSFDFTLTYTITEEDGYQEGTNDLLEIDTSMPNNGSTTIFPTIINPTK